MDRGINSDSLRQSVTTIDGDEDLRRELEAAQRDVRTLLREASKAQRRYEELNRAYRMTVDNLVRASTECSALERERDQWKQKAEQRGEGPTLPSVPLALSLDEIAAIRKAMARLHHPDTGGDAERMKCWNALLDGLERDAS